MITIKELQKRWNSIPPFTGGFLLVSDDHPLCFHIGYIGENQKCFVVLNTGKIDKVISSKAITTENVELEDGSVALSFTLNYATLDELFIKLCWDLIDVSRNEYFPVKRIVEQYNNWIRLLQQGGSTVLTSERQKGLIGELLYLDHMIDKIGQKSAVQGWTGPEGADQDFNFYDHWSEVKAVTIDADEVTISSLHQLDRNDEGYLVVYLMDKTSARGPYTYSLDGIVSKVRGKLAGDECKDSFDCKLAMGGYLDKDAQQYSDIQYRLAEKRIYQVNKSFPRLVRGNIPTEVVSAKYGISLSMIKAFIITEE